MKKIYIVGIGFICAGVLFSAIGTAGVIFSPQTSKKAQQKFNKEYNITDVDNDYSKKESQEIENISIKIDGKASNVTIEKSSNDKCSVHAKNVCYDYYECSIENGTLVINDSAPKTLNMTFTTLGFTYGLKSSKISISLPENVYDSISITNDTGNIKIDDIECKSISLDSSTGDTELKNTSVKDNSVIDNNTGSLEIYKSDLKGNTEISVDTGDIIIDNCDIYNGNITSDIGDIKVDESKFMEYLKCRSDTGSIKMTSSDINCDSDFSVDVGSINLDTKNSCDDFDIRITNDIGNSCINGEKKSFYDGKNNKKHTMTIKNDTGDVDVNFKE